ncbi:MAG: excisionase family DNA-binding protein [Thermodesulfobacteriota bacterium]
MEQVLTLEEAAQYLKVAKPTLYRLLEDGKIPAFKVGNQWRFTRELIDKWLWDQLPKKKNVLILNDNESDSTELRRVISSEGHDIVSVSGSREIDGLLDDTAFDIVFLDLTLADPGSLEVLREIRKQKSDLPVVIIIGYPDSELMNQALDLGPISVLKKPVGKKQLVDLLSILVAPQLNSGRESASGRRAARSHQLLIFPDRHVSRKRHRYSNRAPQTLYGQFHENWIVFSRGTYGGMPQ